MSGAVVLDDSSLPAALRCFPRFSEAAAETDAAHDATPERCPTCGHEPHSSIEEWVGSRFGTRSSIGRSCFGCARCGIAYHGIGGLR